MDKALIKNTAQRLNVYDESVIKKAEEYLRLYQSKASVKTFNDQAKTVLCLDLASQCNEKGFDKEVAVTLCGLKKSAYQNSLNTLEKILGLDQFLTVSDVCVQLGCTAVKEDAQDILSKYKKLDGKIKDLDHPQYVAAATYLACKAKKVSVDKSRMATISRLKPSQWKELINAFESLGLGKSTAKHTNKVIEKDQNVQETDIHNLNKTEEDGEVEEYEVWKSRILKEAYAALKIDQEKMLKMEH